MRRLAILSLTLAIAIMGTTDLFAQRDESDDGDRPRREGRRADRSAQGVRGGEGFRGPGRPGDPSRMPLLLDRNLPLLRALDVDGDGVLSADEIENAAKSLKSLDQNNDGQLSRDEMMPRGTGRRGERGIEGRRGADGRPGAVGRRGAEGRPGPEGRPERGRGRADRDPPTAEAMIKRIMANDKNDDGHISKEELPQRMQRMFERADANADGALDQDEIAAVAERLSQRGLQGRDGGRRLDRGADSDRPQRNRRPQTEE